MKTQWQRLWRWYDEAFPPWSDRRLWLGVVLSCLGLCALVVLIVWMVTPSRATQERELVECRTFCAERGANYSFDVVHLRCTCFTGDKVPLTPTE